MESFGWLAGRRRLFTDETEVTSQNVVRILQKAVSDNSVNVQAIRFLLEYEKGNQPLQRKKEIRPEIDIQVCDNLANEITEFKIGYQWGNPITYIQRGNRDIHGNDTAKDDEAISYLNEMLEDEFSFAKDQELARYVEICGIGYQMVDIKRDFEGGSVFDLITLDPLCTFIVYDHSVWQKPIMAVTFRQQENGEVYYTCISDNAVYTVKNSSIVGEDGKPVDTWEQYDSGNTHRSGEMNPLEKINIIEFQRSYDRMGCFERQISDLDNLNILVSDFSNNVAQDTQSVWWGNDFNFPEDEKGNSVTPSSGQWVMTYSGEKKNPKIQALSVQIQYSGILESIRTRRDTIKQKCNVPLQTEPGGGSTGTAMSMSSGWQAAEVAASKEEQIVRKGKMQIADLILRAIKRSPDLPADSPMLTLNLSDIKVSIVRNRTYDMITKANAFATWVSHGINGRHALQQVEAFPDSNLVWNDSKDLVEKYQKSLFEKKESAGAETNRLQADQSDQISNSPITDGINTGTKPKDIKGGDE